LVIWQCELRDSHALATKIRRFLGRSGHVAGQ
jgi:G:T-mismatch repair DNA endonuclease (very short patch repair protein)